MCVCVCVCVCVLNKSYKCTKRHRFVNKNKLIVYNNYSLKKKEDIYLIENTAMRAENRETMNEMNEGKTEFLTLRTVIFPFNMICIVE